MSVIEAIKARKSIRAYKPDPVPKQLLHQLLETCIWAPSWRNTQPWEFAIIGGKVMAKLKEALLHKMVAGIESNPDIPSPTFPDTYRERTRSLMKGQYDALGIARDDKERRQRWYRTIIQFLGAPNGIIIYIDKSLGTWSILDVGIMLQTIALAAVGYSLGTCIEADVVRYPDVLRDLLHIPESKLIVCGMAIGHPDMDAPVNRFPRGREPLEPLVTWHGFED